MQGVGAPLRRSINPSPGSDVAPVPGIVQAILIGCYPGSGYQRARGRQTSLPAGKGASGLPTSILAGPVVSQRRFVLLSWSPSPTGRLDSWL